MKVGYTRVSTADQNLDLQLVALRAYGCEQIFQDKVSGVTNKRKGLDEAIQYVRTGDTLVVWRLDRLGRTMHHLLKIVNDLNSRDMSFHSLHENITMDLSNATGQLMFHLFASFAEFERNLIRERTEAGRAAARARGWLGGQPEKFDKKEEEMLALDMFGNKDAVIRLDMSEYSDRIAVSKLIGTTAGYVGYEDNSNTLTERVRRNPYSIVLLDEIEKADPLVASDG